MDNLARKDELAQEFGSFLHMISSVSDVKALDQMCHEFLYRQAPQRGLELAAGMSWANPFFLPNMPPQALDMLAVDRGYMAEMVMRAKLTAVRADSLRLLVTSAPFAAPAFFHDALSASLGLAPAEFFASATDPEGLGASSLDQEPDEFALVREGLLPGPGLIAKHAARATGYAVGLFNLYNIRPIVVFRDMADTLADMDAALMDGTAPASITAAMPSGYTKLEREPRLMLLAARFGGWIGDFERSWIRATQEGLARPLFLSYEADFLGDRHLLARKIADFLGPKANAMKLAAVLDDREVAPAGAGSDLPLSVLELLGNVAEAYHGETA
ncbi:hypothetical protein [Rhizobium sp.]